MNAHNNTLGAMLLPMYGAFEYNKSIYAWKV